MTDLERVINTIDWLVFNKKIKNRRELAKTLDYTESSLSQILNKKVTLSESFINKLSTVDKSLSLDWLLTGEGEMLKPTKKEEKLTETEEVITSSGNYKLVPLYNMDARGGFGANDEVDCTKYVVDLIPFKDAKDKDICVPVSGKSMMPTFCPGTVVLLHEIENWIEFLETGQIYVLILKDGRRLIKELRRSEEDRQTNYLCVSHNPDYEPVELPRKLIHRVYMVTAMYQKTSI